MSLTQLTLVAPASRRLGKAEGVPNIQCTMLGTLRFAQPTGARA